ncbi:MAG: hypothetical protein JWO80_1924 [Bryobacterales bacterium]|nr:hypothetical protein [Bryobacterales bacterium]
MGIADLGPQPAGAAHHRHRCLLASAREGVSAGAAGARCAREDDRAGAVRGGSGALRVESIPGATPVIVAERGGRRERHLSAGEHRAGRAGGRGPAADRALARAATGDRGRVVGCCGPDEGSGCVSKNRRPRPGRTGNNCRCGLLINTADKRRRFSEGASGSNAQLPVGRQSSQNLRQHARFGR